jgi:hypothetical protein
MADDDSYIDLYGAQAIARRNSQALGDRLVCVKGNTIRGRTC